MIHLWRLHLVVEPNLMSLLKPNWHFEPNQTEARIKQELRRLPKPKSEKGVVVHGLIRTKRHNRKSIDSTNWQQLLLFIAKYWYLLVW